VIPGFLLKTRAIPILWMGIAFFVASCQPRPPIQKPLEPEPGQALFSSAEAEYMAGNKGGALEGYREYVEKNPRGPRAGDALYRMARIHEEKFEFERALALYQQIVQDYPEYSDVAEVLLDRASTLYRLGRYKESREEALQWLRRFPANPLAGHAFLLLGKSTSALGDEGEAFAWFLRASSAFPAEDPIQQEVESYIAGLLEKADMDSLKRMAEVASETKYLSPIYDRMATLALDANDLDGARDAAMALVRSTSDQHWVDRGRSILDRVSEELAVKKGVLGCLLPLSGPFAIYGQEVLNGIQLGMGIFGTSEESQSIELLIEDTQGSPDVAANKVEELSHEGRVMGIIGPLASKTATAAARKAQELGVPIITFTQKAGITEEGDMVFRNFLTPAREMDRLVSKGIDEMGLVRFGILYPDSAYGRYMLNLFWDRVEKAGGHITAVESYGSELTDFTKEIKKMVGLYYPRPPSIAEKLKAARMAAFDVGVETGAYEEGNEPEPIVDFDAVFIPDNSQKVALIAPQFPFHNVFDIRLLGTSLWNSPDLLDQGAEYLQGAIFPSGFYTQGAEDFVNLYKENFETNPGILAATGYDTIRFLNHLMKTRAPRTRRDLRQALLLSNDFQGIRGPLTFDDQREATTPPVLLTVKGNKLLPLP
jgi:branched-chain amino acid transport system substrate-binding protein